MTHFDRWSQKTSARLFDEDSFIALKNSNDFFLVGVMGFSGSWETAPYQGDQLRNWLSKMKAALQQQLLHLQELHGEKLVMVGGATDLGTLQLSYQVSAELKIQCMAVAPDRALDFPFANFVYAVPVGKEFGDESETFVRLCDQFLLLGGGPQSRRETIAADRLKKCVMVIQGFGGVADQLDSERLPNATFIDAG